MDKLKKAVGWLLLVLWLPATSLCLIERAGWMSKDDCCPSSAPTKSSSNSMCCTLASASYKADDDSHLQITAPLFIGVLFFEAFAGDTEAVQVHCSADDIRQPPLLKTWQFTSRTALPPRAPSFAS